MERWNEKAVEHVCKDCYEHFIIGSQCPGSSCPGCTSNNTQPLRNVIVMWGVMENHSVSVDVEAYKKAARGE